MIVAATTGRRGKGSGMRKKRPTPTAAANGGKDATILVMATIGDDLTAATADTRASPPVPVTAGPFIRRRDRRRGRLLLGRSESIAKTKGRLKARSSDWTPDVLINERDQRRQQQP
eukprot:CAMPEP_0178479108 /NCGR_PEP_ID=MMETSP0696-20121128/5008_1 /TAXON_ID=265572 /ORGANISM="Extubocellulus spinifer, Strain CCMP396" /LENGTH=115 /DNA_ID=CAMNT_0020106503 /DNA_START=139 /DNA_END=483 /DNA_ORIENTATION=-